MKILLLDVELAPIIAQVWQIFDVNIGLNQIQRDWSILSWSAKWLGEKEIMYADQRNVSNIEDDKKLLQKLWKLMDKADVIVGQNSKKFDTKKLNSRFIFHGMQPPSSYKQIDTLVIAKKHFGMTSNKLEYLSDKLCTKYKKLKHKKFPGHEMWAECLKGNKEAWQAMERYNKYDVLALEELYTKLQPWDNSVNFNIYSTDEITRCNCGSTDFYSNGHFYGANGKFKRYKCKKCGAEVRDRKSVLSPEKKASLKELKFKK